MSHAHELHRGRRKPVELYFSRLGVTKLEPLINRTIEKLIARFESLSGDVAGRLTLPCYVGFLL